LAAASVLAVLGLLGGLFVVAGAPVLGRLFPAPTAPAQADTNAFAPALDGQPDDRRAALVSGGLMFNHEWIVHAGPKDVDFDGLGPLFNQASCISCHIQGSRGRVPEHADQPLETMIVRLSMPAEGPTSKPGRHPAYGDQLNSRSIAGVPAEGSATLTFEEVSGSYGDGTAYTLLRPNLKFVNLTYGPLDGALTSLRMPQPVIGLGLLESVPTEELEKLSDPEDADGDGISGRINWLEGPDGAPVAGRFGWKAIAPGLAEQAAEAGLNDMGLTSRARLVPNCTDVQPACRAAAVRPRPDMSDRFFPTLVTYLQLTRVPERRGADQPKVREGEALFAAFGCTQCHRPTLRTGATLAIAKLGGGEFHPFTDLLLHDMGEGLADGRPEGSASGREWRTAPLWGLGLTSSISGHDRLLHDGRARGLAEAILWHGGEAKRAREAFRNASAGEREALVAFLNSL
jgi:CxxC motif-containing protein (DUF1111 family)